MMIETVRLSQGQRNKLLKIRKKTGIKNWNVLCRWALCRSLAVDVEPPPYVKGGKTGIEMDWITFTGKNWETLFTAILKLFGSEQFYNHLNRGIELLLIDEKLMPYK